MGIDELLVNLTTPPGTTFKPGDVVTGTVFLKTSPNEDLKEGMTVTLYGYGHVEWTQSSGSGGGGTTTYKSHEDLFEESQFFRITPGQSSHAFSMIIPHRPLPRSITLSRGRIEYGIKAVIKRSWYTTDRTAFVLVTLRPPVNPSTTASSEPCLSYVSSAVTSKTNDSKVGVCCFPLCCMYYMTQEKVKMTLTTQSLWAYPGEGVPYTLHIDNSNTSRPLENVQIQLISNTLQIGKYFALLGSDNTQEDNKYSETVCEDILLLRVEPGDQFTTSGVFQIPHHLTSNPSLIESSVIKVVYKLQAMIQTVEGNNGMCQMPVDVEVDLMIGTV